MTHAGRARPHRPPAPQPPAPAPQRSARTPSAPLPRSPPRPAPPAGGVRHEPHVGAAHRALAAGRAAGRAAPRTPGQAPTAGSLPARPARGCPAPSCRPSPALRAPARTGGGPASLQDAGRRARAERDQGARARQRRPSGLSTRDRTAAWARRLEIHPAPHPPRHGPPRAVGRGARRAEERARRAPPEWSVTKDAVALPHAPRLGCSGVQRLPTASAVPRPNPEKGSQGASENGLRRGEGPCDQRRGGPGRRGFQFRPCQA